MNVAVVFPHQLFAANPLLNENIERVFLVEDSLFFTQLEFHKQKLVLHRASMRFYAEYLRKRGFDVRYVESAEVEQTEQLADVLQKQKVSRAIFCDVADDWLENRFVKSCDKAGIKTTRFDTSQFLNTRQDLARYFGKKSRFYMENFYESERRRLGVLLDADNQPIGGRWNFDDENRKKLPRKIFVPRISKPAQNEFVREAIDYVNKNFSKNLGRAEDFWFSTTFAEADVWLDEFLRERFQNFGAYEDAIAKGEPHLFHAVTSHAINSGLLTPRQILDKALSYADEHAVPLNSLEGFVRQIIGWREFNRGCYEQIGRKQRTRNFFKHTNKLPASFWTATTGVEPVDAVIRRVLDNAYCHHIERLMILGNFMLLTEIAPDAVYEWFSAMFIDAYNWVMVTNVYGISQFADGGLMATKPYISGSNYIKKMSDFGNGDWTEIWDGLYWRFIQKHEKYFATNPRYKLSLDILARMDAEKCARLLDAAENFLTEFHR